MHPPVVSRASVRSIVVLVLAAAILWVPAAVRATGTVHGPATSGIRLNRGFDVPVENEFGPPSDTPSLVSTILKPSPATSAVARVCPLDSHEILPDTPDTVAPELLRGPPSSLVV